MPSLYSGLHLFSGIYMLSFIASLCNFTLAYYYYCYYLLLNTARSLKVHLHWHDSFKASFSKELPIPIVFFFPTFSIQPSILASAPLILIPFYLQPLSFYSVHFNVSGMFLCIEHFSILILCDYSAFDSCSLFPLKVFLYMVFVHFSVGTSLSPLLPSLLLCFLELCFNSRPTSNLTLSFSPWDIIISHLGIVVPSHIFTTLFYQNK